MSLLFAAASTDRVDFAAPAVLLNLHASTFSGWAWVYRTANGTNKHIMTKDNSGPNGWGLVCVNTAAEGGITLVVQRNIALTQFTSDASNVIPLNTWCLVGFAYDPTGSPQVRLFIGTLTTTIAEVSGYSATTAGSGTHKTETANLYVGNLQRANTNSFTGRIARAGLSTSLLTAADFRRIQWGSAYTLPPGTVWAAEIWGIGASNCDLTGAGNNGTVTGTTIVDGLPLMMPYAVMAGDPSGGSAAADTTKPVFAGASVPADGLTVSVSLTDAGTLLPTSGVTGFSVTVAGAAATISSATASGTTVTLTVSAAVYSGQTVTVAYTPGNVTDNSSNVLDAFTAQSVTNNSTVTNAIAPNHANIYYPGAEVWSLSSSNARCNIQGNYFFFAVNTLANETISLSFDTSRYNGLTAATTPTIDIYMDGSLVSYGSPSYVQLTTSANTQTITLAAAPSNGRHVFRVVIRSMEQATNLFIGMWGTGGSIPPVAVDITSIGLGPTSTMATLTAGSDYYANTAVFVGDSRTVGVLANIEQGNSATTTNAANNNSEQGWAYLLRSRLACEIILVGQGGLGYQVQNGTYQGSATKNPPLYGAGGAGAGEKFTTYRWNGLTRTYAQTHKYVFIQAGVNDGGAATPTMIAGVITDMRSACGTTPWILQVVDPGQAERADTTTAVAGLVGSDAKLKLIDTGVQLVTGVADVNGYSSDGSHMNHQGQIQWANLVYAQMITAGVITATANNWSGNVVDYLDGRLANAAYIMSGSGGVHNGSLWDFGDGRLAIPAVDTALGAGVHKGSLIDLGSNKYATPVVSVDGSTGKHAGIVVDCGNKQMAIAMVLVSGSGATVSGRNMDLGSRKLARSIVQLTGPS